MFKPIECLHTYITTLDGTESDCEYEKVGEFGECENCILCGGNYDPRTGKLFVGKYKGELKKYKRLSMKSYEDQEPIESLTMNDLISELKAGVAHRTTKV